MLALGLSRDCSPGRPSTNAIPHSAVDPNAAGSMHWPNAKGTITPPLWSLSAPIRRALWEVRERSIPARMPEIMSLRRRISAEVLPSGLPWHRAEQAARIARETWSLAPGPVQTEALCDLFDIARPSVVDLDSVIDIPVSVGFRDGESPGAFRVSWNRRHPTARRFALARLVGDHLDARENERLLPATDARTSRQKFQRAFAQEFLCPFDDLRDFLGMEPPSDDEIERAAEHFDVSPLLVKTVLVNKKVLGRESLGD